MQRWMKKRSISNDPFAFCYDCGYSFFLLNRCFDAKLNRKQQFVNIVILCITAEMVFSCQFCIKNTAAASYRIWNGSEIKFLLNDFLVVEFCWLHLAKDYFYFKLLRCKNFPLYFILQIKCFQAMAINAAYCTL